MRGLSRMFVGLVCQEGAENEKRGFYNLVVCWVALYQYCIGMGLLGN